MKTILSILLAAVAFGQGPNVPRYAAIKETVLSTAAEKVTVQHSASSPKAVYFDYADFYCSVACQITLSQNGTAATTTALGITSLNGAAQPASNAFSASNVGSGTTLYTYYLNAGDTRHIDLSALFLARGGGTGSNLSFGSNSITGTVRIQVQWREQ